MASICLHGGPWVEKKVELWSMWMFRIVPLLSLASHLILAVFADIRRHKESGFRRSLVWVAYQLTDWAPAYVIGNLYVDTSPRDKTIVAFWVPFLLLHNARPDNINAYSMEDSGLSARLMIVVPFQTFGSIYLMCRYIFMDCTTGLLRHASCILMFLGIFKYVESAVALRRAEMGNIWSSLKQQRHHVSSSSGYYSGDGQKQLNDEEALLVAHDLFDICKGAFSDYSVDYMDRDVVKNMFSDQWESMYKVVEMELSLMYDILYTKAAVVHTWGGYAIRVASPLLMATTLLLFCIQHKKGKEPADTIISYILLWTTFLLDLRWLLRALASTWTYSFFKDRPDSWLLKHELFCQERWNKLRLWVVSRSLSRLSLWLWTYDCAKKHKSYRRLEGGFGRCNLLEQCSGGKRHNLYSISRLKLESKDSMGLEIPDYVKQLVFNVICAELFPAPLTPTVQLSDIAIDGSPESSPSSSPGLSTDGQGSLGLLDSHDHDSTSRYGYQGAQSSHWPSINGHQCPPRPGFDYRGSSATDGDGHQVSRLDHLNKEVSKTPPRPYEQAYPWRNVHAGSRYDQANKQVASAPTDIFHKLQEAILIWHIATDVFLSGNHTVAQPALQYHGKAIKAMSDYMVFLIVKHPSMLPGLKLRSLYEGALLTTLKEIVKIKEKDEATNHTTTKEMAAKELATWMLENVDHLKDPSSAIWERKMENHMKGLATLSEGTQIAQVLLNQTQNGKYIGSGATSKSVHKLSYWIPALNGLPSDISMDDMLQFILQEWIHLLILVSIRASREAQAKQLGHGSGITTLVWIITEHAKDSIVQSKFPSFFH